MNGPLPPHRGLNKYSFAFSFTHSVVGDNSVGTATRCGLDGPGNEFWRGRNFPHPSRPRILYYGYRVSFLGVKRLGRDVSHPLTSSTEVKERVYFYLYSLSRSSWPVLE
jgi:hypothetical protein